MQTTLSQQVQWAIKHVIEWLAALILLAFTLPVQLLIALVIRLDTPGPALFIQNRLGRHGRVFRMYKFRTLRWEPGAKPVTRADGSTVVSNFDSRLTRVGKRLRVGWDELPQLWNVVRGEMALIGPRPDEPVHRQYYTPTEEEKLSVLPGITGLPQASGRNEIPWKERIAMDLQYIHGYSLLLDLKIVLRTARLLLFRKGSGTSIGRKEKINMGALWRIAADVVVVNASLATALGIRLIVQMLSSDDLARTHVLIQDFQEFYLLGAPILTILTVAIFEGFGVYSRTRFYARKHKAWVLFQSVALTYLIFIFVLNFLDPRFQLISRSVVLMSFGLTFLFAGGSRLLKNYALESYHVVRRQPHREVPIEKVLVVGGAGYIGSLLTRQLLDKGYSVRILDASIYGNQAIEELVVHPRFEFVQGDLRNVEAVVKAINGCQAIMHLGAIVGDPACDLNERITREINTLATKLLLQVARGYGIQKLVFASTCAVYGASDNLMEERMEINPVSLYARSKADAEKIVIESASRDFCPAVLRLGTVFGQSYRPRFDLVVHLLVAKARQEKKFTVFNKEQWRPFVHVHDVARAFVTCLEASPEVIRGEVFNVGDNRLNQTLGDLAEKVRAVVPEVHVEYVENNDRRNYRVNCDKIRNLLGFTCEKSLDDGIREVNAFLEKEQAKAFADPSYDNSKWLKTIGEAQLEAKSEW